VLSKELYEVKPLKPFARASESFFMILDDLHFV